MTLKSKNRWYILKKPLKYPHFELVSMIQKWETFSFCSMFSIPFLKEAGPLYSLAEILKTA